ncbi:MAG: TonB-dependent receptor [Pseudomonadota bacterium]|nr:TonB-dependent receptor [Pseudomonadota bacterium]
MRLKSVVLCSTSFAALAIIATPAAAQIEAQDEPTPQAQETPGDPEAGSPQVDDAVQTADTGAGEEAIVVTGIRRSLQSAQNIRRNSEQIVDAVVAEDIGKLPDLAVSDTAARIPGVQVVRTGGEASRVLVRGLPDFSTTYNGREIFTAETRVVALQDFPSANIAALEVFKTTTANLVEAGLAGQVNVRSRRPFDFQGLELAGSVWGLYTVQAGEWNPNFNALASTRWDVGAGEMGFLINVSRTEIDYLDSEPSNTDFLQTFRIEGDRLICCGPADARFPDIQRLFYRSGNRVRPSVNAAFQWRPSRAFELYAEFLWQGFRNRVDDRLVAVPLYNGGSYSNLVFRPGSNVLESGTVTGLADPIFTFQGGTFNKTNTFQYAVGGIYDQGPLRITADFARTDSRFTGSTESVDRIFRGQETTAVDFDLTTPQFTIRNFDVTDPNNYLFDGLYEEAQVSEGDDWQARVDAEYDFDDSLFRSIQVGARYTTRDAHREFGNRFAGFRGRGINASVLPLEFELARRGFRGTDVQSGFETFLTPTYRSIRDNRVELREFVIAQGITCCFGTFTTDPPAPNPASVYDANEDTLAGYGQINFDFGEVADATVGMRVVRTETELSGNSIVEGVVTPVTLGRSYTDWLPNVSLRLRPVERVQVRLSFTETRTRPTFEQLNPSFSLGAPDPLQEGRRTGGGGNPFLEPFTSLNYDAAIEYYFRRTGVAALSVFRRELEGFIQNQTEDFDIPGIGPVRVTVPVNTREGRIQGLEAQFTTFFDFEGLPSFFHPFGIQANYTYLDDEVEVVNAAGDTIVDDIITPGFGGVSAHTVNLVGLYERGPLSGRLTYNWRSNYLDRRDIRGDEEGGFYREFADPPARVDLSINFTPFENATIFFDWTNITGNPFRVNFSSARAGQPRAEYVRFLRYEETTFSLGLRFRL